MTCGDAQRPGQLAGGRWPIVEAEIAVANLLRRDADSAAELLATVMMSLPKTYATW